MFSHFCSQQSGYLTPLIRGSLVSLAMTNAEYLNPQPIDSDEQQSNLDYLRRRKMTVSFS